MLSFHDFIAVKCYMICVAGSKLLEWRSVLNLDQFDGEVEGCPAGDDPACAAVAVAKVRRHNEHALLTHAHARHALLVSLDNLDGGDKRSNYFSYISCTNLESWCSRKVSALTWPAPSWKLKVGPRSLEASNFFPFPSPSLPT